MPNCNVHAVVPHCQPLIEDHAVSIQPLACAAQGKGQDASVYVAMRYWKPFTEDAIAQIKADGVTKLVILPLYPQFSISTSGSSLRLLEQIFKTDASLLVRCTSCMLGCTCM